MKRLHIIIACAIIFASIYGCSNNREPQFRIKNEQQNNVSVKVKTPGSNQFIANEVKAGKSTEFEKVTIGDITVTVEEQNESISFIAETNNRYTIVINDGLPPSLKVEKY